MTNKLCPFCDQSFEMGEMKSHLKSNHLHEDPMPTKQPKIDTYFKLEVSSIGSIKEQAQEKPNSSGFKCDKQFGSESILKIHNIIAHKSLLDDNNHNSKTSLIETPNFISVTEKTSLNRSLMEAPQKSTKKQLAKYQCSKCNIGFESQKSLERHMDLVHRCDQSLKNETTKMNKMQITKRKTKIKEKASHVSFKCILCKEEKATKQSLNNHIKFVHAKVKAVQCSLCPRKFIQKNDVEKHIKSVHLKTKVTCEECPDKTLLSFRSLKEHMKRHHAKDHYCEDCEKTFSSRFQLQNHRGTAHRGKEFKCEFCNKTFGSADPLRVHEQSQHLGVRHTCDTCGNSYANYANLRRHTRTFHK